MSIRFARAKTNSSVSLTGPLSNRRARALRRRSVYRVANDNCPGAQKLEASQRVLDAALRHFAKHGLDAAQAAQSQAHAALADGDREAFETWVAITGTFDPQLAKETSKPNKKTDPKPKSKAYAKQTLAP